MKKSENIHLRLATADDFKNIASLMAGQKKDALSTAEYIAHWYGDNPSGNYSLAVYSLNDKLEGFASTNNFIFKIAGRRELVAMPQKVLTSKKIRGSGVFGQLYRMIESDNFKRGVNFFLTFTNSMSTPIFLEKFGYIRGESPEIYLLFANPIGFRHFSRSYQFVTKFDENYWKKKNLLQSDNSLFKTPTYYEWRYQGFNRKSFIKLEVKHRNELMGYAILKRLKKKGIPFYAVADLITHSHENIKELIRAALTHATKRISLGIMLCHHELSTEMASEFMNIRFADRLNFLVKGRTAAETKKLSEIKFNFSFGDFDFI